MKKNVIYSLALVVCAMFLSCQNDFQDVDQKLIDEIQVRNDNDILLERRMQWASFITAKVLKNSEEGRAYLLNVLNHESALDIDILLDTPNAFYNTFYSYLLDYLEEEHVSSGVIGDPRPDLEKDKPRRPIMNSRSPEQDAADYIEYLVNLNCVQLYFPNDLQFPEDGFIMTSVAHPLVESDSNKGFIRYFTEVTPDGSITEAVIVDPTYVVVNDNIIVARPKRIFADIECSYLEFPGLDFTEFLNPN